jgi:hypothetical protein
MRDRRLWLGGCACVMEEDSNFGRRFSFFSRVRSITDVLTLSFGAIIATSVQDLHDCDVSNSARKYDLCTYPTLAHDVQGCAIFISPFL